MENPVEVAIVGGGIAGLAAAFELQQRGIGFLLLEKRNRPGGVILTDRLDGFIVDAGPDALLVQKPAAIDLCRELGLGDRLVATKPPRTAYILRRGRLHPLPESSVLGIPTGVGPLARSPLFSLAGKLRMSLDLVMRPPRSPASDESIARFIHRHFGDEAVTYLAEPLLAGIHAGDVERLSMRALFPRMLEAEARHGSLMRAFRAARHHPAPEGAFCSLAGGLTEMVDALLSRIDAGRLRCGASVVAMEARDTYILKLASGSSLRARAVIVAVPAFVAADLVKTLDRELSSLCGEIRYVSSATVALGYDADAIGIPLVGSGFVVPRVEPERRLTAASWVSSKWPNRAPADKVLLRAFLGGVRDPEVLSSSDEHLIDEAHTVLASLLKISEPPLVARAYRWPRGTPQHEVGHVEKLQKIEHRLNAHPGLLVTGSGFRGTGIPDCIADGRAMAERAAEGLKR
ncbi:MAG: protoporphyrinogen oxidase [Acidobacteria bacterium]|nr:protoporphyrinogen oxidase [Acidobacteriota bacterium]